MMTIEILFNESCNLMGDGQNAAYLQATLPEAAFVFTALTDEPYFVENTPDIVYIGSMTEKTQRRVIEKLIPYKDVTEGIKVPGLGIFDLTVKNDLFKRYNGKVLGETEGLTIVGFRSQFSFLYGDNQSGYFLKCKRGIGINKDTPLEGMRKKNLICTQLLGPILPLNPEFCEYFIGLTGVKATAAYKEAAMSAYLQRLKEFTDPVVPFDC